MALSILITQCLQRDFVDPVRRHDTLPNLLHVGSAEAERLLGPEPAVGPVAQVMAWAREQPADELRVFHIRDWHDPADERQQDHLERFGGHCIVGTRGSEFVLGLVDEKRLAPNEQVLDSLSLNDFEGTDLDDRLRALRDEHGEIRVAVIGVWTEAKVSFLLYDLATRLGIESLATCSALTASASRQQHFNALEQLHQILGVQAFDSVGELVDWLRPGSHVQLTPSVRRFGTPVEVVEGPPLQGPDADIVGHLYRDSATVKLRQLAGGFSGAMVFGVKSWDARGHEQAPSVIKLGDHQLIGHERVAFEQVEEVLGNHAPSVRGFLDLDDRAGIKYSYAAMGSGRVTTFKALVESGPSQARIDAVLHDVFDQILGPFYAASRYERLPLLDHYGFQPKWAGHVRRNVSAIVGPRVDDEQLEFPGGYRAGNVCRFYEQFLSEPWLPRTDYHYRSTIHGDLNGANIIIDDRENVWIIDFFHTGPGHVLRDLAKLENDLLYIFTHIETPDELAQALRITRALRDVQDLAAELPAEVEGLQSPELKRAWQTVRTLRGIGARLCREDRHPLQMDLALLRYAVHTLSFDESSPLQKEWALAAACGFADDAEQGMRADFKLRVDWLDDELLEGPGRLGLTICPGRRDRGRDLAADLDALAEAGASRVLCLLGDEELRWAGVADMESQAVERGMVFRQAPILDQGVPGHEDARELARWCLGAVADGERVVVHCMGGLGRAGTVAACTLVERGLAAEDAIVAVRRARGARAVETAGQERFVGDHARVCGEE